LLVIGSMLTISLLGTAASFSLSPQRGATAIVRLFISAMLCFFLYKGRRWARIVAVVLLTPTALASMAGAFITEDLGFAAISAVLSLVCTTAAVLLVFSSGAREYFARHGA
jgi:hypothetical protein